MNSRSFYSALEFFKKNSVIDSDVLAYSQGGNTLQILAIACKVEEGGLFDTPASFFVALQQEATHDRPWRSF
jgi:hypothetical protein